MGAFQNPKIFSFVSPPMLPHHHWCCWEFERLQNVHHPHLWKSCTSLIHISGTSRQLIMMMTDCLFYAVFGHRFIIVDADNYVLNYMESNLESFPASVVQSMRHHFAPRRAAIEELKRWALEENIHRKCSKSNINYADSAAFGLRIMEDIPFT